MTWWNSIFVDWGCIALVYDEFMDMYVVLVIQSSSLDPGMEWDRAGDLD